MVMNQAEFDKLIDKMVDYNIFQYAIALKGEKGYDFSDEFRTHLLRSIEITKYNNHKAGKLELFISSIMTFNTNIPFELAKEMGYVLGGRHMQVEEILKSRSKLN